MIIIKNKEIDQDDTKSKRGDNVPPLTLSPLFACRIGNRDIRVDRRNPKVSLHFLVQSRAEISTIIWVDVSRFRNEL